MELREKGTEKSPVKTMLIVFICILVNFIGKRTAAALELPLWLDSLGTGFSAYVLGPVSGAIVGCAGNVIYSFWEPNTLIYGITSIFIGLCIGIAARENRLSTLFGATSIAGVVAIVSAIISTILNVLIFDGSTGNIWGNGVRDYLAEKGVPIMLSAVLGEMYLDFLDKLVTILALYALIRAGRMLRGRRIGRKLANLLIVLLVVGMVLPSAAYAYDALDASYIQQVYDADGGLPCGRANDIAQTSNGILWIGTDSGLYRYSGSSFRLMNEAEFSNVKNVNCLYVDQEGRLWIGTNDSGLVLAISEKVANTLGGENGLPSDSVRCIVQSADGDYYVGTADQMAIVRITIGIAVAETIPEVCGAKSVSADQMGYVAAVTSEGRLFLLKEHTVFCEVPAPDQGAAFSACAFDGDGLLQVGTTDGRILSYRVTENGAEEIRSMPCEAAEAINQIFFQDEITWILADNGIWAMQDGAVQPMDTGDFNTAIERMTVDYQGNLWFASSKHGLLQLSETVFPNLNIQYGLPAETVHTTCVKDGILYIGTDTGLAAVGLTSRSVLDIPLSKALSGVPVTCAMTDSADNLWICSRGKGLLRVSPDGTIRTVDGTGDTADLCAELPDGSIAAVGSNGLVLFRGEETVTIPYGGELGTARILSICGLPDGRILLGTDGDGIVVIKNGTVTGHLTKADGLSSGVVQRIVPDGNTGRLFLVTGNGLCILENDAITPIENFPYSDNYDIVLDDDGEMFVLGSAGIYVVRKEDLLSGGSLEYSLLDHRTGLRGPLTERPWNAVNAEKDLYLSTEHGVILMNLDTYQARKRSYRLMVSEIRLDGRSVPIERGSGLTIGRDVSSIEFFAEIVNYSREEPKVSYYLEGVDSGYKTVAQSELGSVVYTNLPFGEYTFHLAIIDEDSGKVWEESTYGFLKEKSIHDNGWFLIYMLIVGGLFIGWVTWCLTRYGAQRTIAIQQEKLALALKQVQMGNETILAIAKTVDAKDSLTSQHSQRVSEYSTLIAKKAGFSGQEQENLRKAALLHDIGKIGIPDSILNKPARLTDREYAVMKTHVTRGAEILKDFTLIDHVVEGAKFHHERYDGTGYPDGLAGKEIPLYGRIIAIADAFDAMTANRVYRKKQDFSYVLDELHKGRGTQFDPELLDLFLSLLEEGEIDVGALYGESPVRNEEGQDDA